MIALDRDHALGAFEQQPARQAAGTRANLDDGAPIEIAAGCTRDAAREVEIENEILSQALLGVELIAADHLAQRRQTIGLAPGLESAFASSSRCAALRRASLPRHAAPPWYRQA